MLSRKCLTTALTTVSLLVASYGAAEDIDLRLVINSDKPVYLVAEPVVVKMRLQNTGTSSIMVSPEMDAETGNTVFLFAAADGEFIPYDHGISDEPSLPAQNLAPGDQIVHDQALIYQWPNRDFVFGEPGTWRIKVRHLGFGVQPDFDSNTISITVNAPLGEDAEAMQLFRTQEVALLALGVSESSAAISSLQTLLSNYADSTYAEYARRYLARKD
jgi:hypothetical protein